MGEIIGVVVCTSTVVKIKNQLPFKEFSILYIEDRVVVNFEREPALKSSPF